jgi:hypothetical protein
MWIPKIYNIILSLASGPKNLIPQKYLGFAFELKGGKFKASRHANFASMVLG